MPVSYNALPTRSNDTVHKYTVSFKPKYQNQLIGLIAYFENLGIETHTLDIRDWETGVLYVEFTHSAQVNLEYTRHVVKVNMVHPDTESFKNLGLNKTVFAEAHVTLSRLKQLIRGRTEYASN